MSASRDRFYNVATMAILWFITTIGISGAIVGLRELFSDPSVMKLCKEQAELIIPIVGNRWVTMIASSFFVVWCVLLGVGNSHSRKAAVLLFSGVLAIMMLIATWRNLS